MNKKFTITLGTIIGVFLIGLIALGVIFLIVDTPEERALAANKNANYGVAEDNVHNLDDVQENINLETNINESTGEIQVISYSLEDARSLARSFVERYGSFSNQNHYENLTNLKIFMTAEMWSQAEEVIATGENNQQAGDDYYGIVTSVISLQKLVETEDSYSFKITCQRRETSSSLEEANVFFQDIDLVLVSDSDNTWKVSQATWL